MKLRKETVTKSGAPASSRDTSLQSSRMQSSQEMREVAEAVSLYRSAMHHVAEKHALRPFVADRRPSPSFRMRLVLVPALAAALAAAVLAPAIGHLHRHAALTPAPVAHLSQPAPTQTVASVDDTQLMSQIDNDLSEDVPDALQPLADLGEQTTAARNSVTEKKNVTQE